MSSAYDRNRAVIDEFRANAGKVGGVFEGRTLLILHTVGARTGLERINPLAYVRAGERLVIIASKGGAPTHPNWYHNLLANPRVSVEVGKERFEAEAVVAPEPERSRLYAKMVDMMPVFAGYQERTTRIIPVITLKRAS